LSRIVIWSPNYAPELTGIPPLVTDAADWLSGRGHRVEVITPMPNYPERRIPQQYRGRLWMTEQRGGVTVRRNWIRVRPEERFVDKALYELTVASLGLPNALKAVRRADVVLCVVPTVLAAFYSVALLQRQARVVLWVQDLVARAAESVGVPKRAHGILAATAAAEAWIVRHADRVVVCSPGFRDYYVHHGANPAAFDVIYNWADLSQITGQPVDTTRDGPTRFLYAGNLGYTQGLETLLEAFRSSGSDDTLDIVGNGNAAGDIAHRASDIPRVTLRPPVPQEDFPRLLSEHDVHVVVQRRTSAGANLPSKIATYLASGRPVIASIDPATAAAQLLRESGGAILVAPEDPGALAEAMTALSRQQSLRRELGRCARDFAEKQFDKDAALQRLEAALVL
jgi:colanic acid biosynthesis glycosyl transferase WcaI